MRRTSLTRSRTPLALGLVALVAVSACTIKETETPAPAGPSDFGLSISLVATPDVLPQDGFSRAQVVIDARNANGEPDRGRALIVRSRCESGQEFGRLSASSVVTGSDGKATVDYVPPSGFTACSCDLGFPYVTIEALPADPNYAGAAPRSTRIRLAPQMPDPVPGAPYAFFRFTPAAPVAGQQVAFDSKGTRDCQAGQSQQECLAGAPSTRDLVYQWNWGDGEGGSGETEEHDYLQPGCYAAMLAVTNRSNLTGLSLSFISVAPAQ